MTLLEMQQRLAAISSELNAIKSAKQLGNRPFTDDEKLRMKALFAERDELQAKIEAASSDDEFCKSIESLSIELAKTPGRKTQPDQLATETRIEVVPPQGFKSLGEQLQAIAGVAMTGRDDNRLKWENLSPASGGAVAGVPCDGG